MDTQFHGNLELPRLIGMLSRIPNANNEHPKRRYRVDNMAKKTERNLIVGLDIGTSKVAAIVGELTSDGNIEVIFIVSPDDVEFRKVLFNQFSF